MYPVLVSKSKGIVPSYNRIKCFYGRCLQINDQWIQKRGYKILHYPNIFITNPEYYQKIYKGYLKYSL